MGMHTAGGRSARGVGSGVLFEHIGVRFPCRKKVFDGSLGTHGHTHGHAHGHTHGHTHACAAHNRNQAEVCIIKVMIMRRVQS